MSKLFGFHLFSHTVPGISLPERFTYPFHYTPHPLCVMAAEEVQAYLSRRNDWAEELQHGKMFGVMVVKNRDGCLGFLAAFSGILAGSNLHTYFVPPVYDFLQPDGFFKKEELEISNLNHRIESLLQSDTYKQVHKNRQEIDLKAREELARFKEAMLKAKQERDNRRKGKILSKAEEEMLAQESRYLKAEYKRLQSKWKTEVDICEKEMIVLEDEIKVLKKERKLRSAALQQALFSRFRMLNAYGEEKDLCHIFSESGRMMPPAGAGECAAPKLLQYAYINNLYPLAMAEFWWGDSPKEEVRKHGCYYPSCKGKCEPILKHMLQGLVVDSNPLLEAALKCTEPEVVYEDEVLVVVDKPAGMLSVPGKDEAFSVWKWMKEHYSDATGPLVVHRLDMATSGLMLLAKNKEVHAFLQAQFETRQVRKCYVALLEGEVLTDGGFIRLPLGPDLNDRPRQMVDYTYGKPAVTRFVVLERKENYTRVAFYPYTGRTHQLRVHAAHVSGLNAPIVGDSLYGKPADRLYLHAEKLEFCHPVTGKWIKVEKSASF